LRIRHPEPNGSKVGNASFPNSTAAGAIPWRSTMEINATKIESVQVDQSVLGRILGFGTITARGTGTGLEPVRRVASPLEFRAAIGRLQQMVSP
jgi:Bacterial PH domain